MNGTIPDNSTASAATGKPGRWWRRAGAALAAALMPGLAFLAIAGGRAKLPDYALESALGLLIVLAAFVLGAWPVERYAPRAAGQPLRFVLCAVASGFALLSGAGLLLGACGLLYDSVLLGGLALAAAWGAWRWRHYAGRLTPAPPELAADERIMLALFALLALCNLAAAFSPVIFYDALVYHLNIPAEYLKAHQMLPLPYNLHSNLPLAMSMLYLFALPVASGVTAQLLNCLFGVLAAGAVYLAARHWCDRRRALLAMVLFYSIPVVALFATLLQADIGCAFYGLLAVDCLMLYRRQAAPSLLALAGIFGGMTLGYKYQSVIIIAILACFIVVPGRLLRARTAPGPGKLPPDQTWRRRAVALAGFGLVVLLVFAPWLAKNYFFTGNPVFPVAYDLFGGGDWDREQIASFMHHSREQPGGSGAGRLATLLQVLHGESVLGGHRFLFWAVLLALPLAWARYPAAGLTGGLAFAGLLAWCLLTNRADNILRYSLFLMALLCLAAAVLCPDFSGPRRGLLRLAVLVFIGGEVLAAVTLNQNNLNSFTPVFTAEPRASYLARTVSCTPLLDRAQQVLPAEAKLLFIGEARGFYCRRPGIVPSAVDGGWLMKIFAAARDREEIGRRLQALGVTHIVLNMAALPELRREFGYLDWRTAADEENFRGYIGTRRPCARAGDFFLLAVAEQGE